MARITITDEQVDAGSPINETLMKDRIKNNDDDHETRIVTLEGDSNAWQNQIGVGSDSDMGTFTGSVLDDSSDIKALLQQCDNVFSAHGRDSTAARQTTTATSYQDIASISFTSEGEAKYVYYQIHYIGQNSGVSADYRLYLDASASFNAQDKIIYTYYWGQGASKTSEDHTFTSGSTSDSFSATGQVYTGVSAPNTDSWFGRRVIIPRFTMSAGSHTIKLQMKTSNASWAANARDVILNVV